jgi:hypothetical protein
MTCHSSSNRRFPNHRALPTPQTKAERAAGPTSPQALELRKPMPVAEPTVPQERVETTAPIGMAVLRRKFTENIKFVLDYDEGKYKGKVFMTYLSNLDIDCEVTVEDDEALKELLTDYFHLPAIVHIALLEDVAINVLLAASGRPFILRFDPAEYIQQNREIIDVWLKRLYSLHLFAMHCTNKYDDYVKSFPHDDNDSVVGLNYVSLIKHHQFPVMMSGVQESDYSWNATLFNKYVFAGSNLFSFFAVQENPLFSIVMAMQKPEHHKEFVYQLDKSQEAATGLLKGLPHVPSV